MEKGPFSLRCCAILEYEGVWSDETINDPDDVSTSKLVENKGSTTTNGSCRIIRSFKYLKNKNKRKLMKINLRTYIVDILTTF